MLVSKITGSKISFQKSKKLQDGRLGSLCSGIDRVPDDVNQ